jgi:hypothetical protein
MVNSQNEAVVLITWVHVYKIAPKGRFEITASNALMSSICKLEWINFESIIGF